jgi:predicted RNA-binding Zn ribbon-like protein
VPPASGRDAHPDPRTASAVSAAATRRSPLTCDTSLSRLGTWPFYDRMRNRSTPPIRVSQPDFLWLGEHLALDFLNTEPNVRGLRVELLDDFRRLVAWCREAELISDATAGDVSRRWGSTRNGARTLALARRMRGELRLALERRRAAKRQDARSLAALNDCLRFGGASIEVGVASGGRFVRRTQLEPTRPEQLLRPIADAAVELLCDVDADLVRRCDNPACVLYFHDVSKNHARRWCSMALCGNRTKVAAHHARRRAKTGATRDRKKEV